MISSVTHKISNPPPSEALKSGLPMPVLQLAGLFFSFVTIVLLDGLIFNRFLFSDHLLGDLLFN